MKKKISLFLVGIMLITAVIFAGCGGSTQKLSISDCESEALKWVEDIISGNFENCYNAFDLTMKNAVSLSQLKEYWSQQTSPLGNYLSVSGTETGEADNYIIIIVNTAFENGTLPVRLVYDYQKKVSGLFFLNVVPVDDEITDENIGEEVLTVDAGIGFPLPAILSYNKTVTEKMPAVVIVHGSGPVDKDGTVGLNKIYKQIAQKLATQGICTLRYDKRTFTYGEGFAKDTAKATVEDETIQDAISAVNLLKQNSKVDPDKIYIIGHSLGGMLASRIEKEGADAAGLIMLAGSPRKLWEIIYDQNQPGLEKLKATDEAEYTKYKKIVDDEYAKCKTLKDMNDEEALNTTVFSMPAWYLRDMEKYDAADLLKESGKPALILQGSDDFQVYIDKDFEKWKTDLNGYEKATFKLYQGLGHLFTPASTDPATKGTTAEYNVKADVSNDVINDIVNFVKK